MTKSRRRTHTYSLVQNILIRIAAIWLYLSNGKLYRCAACFRFVRGNRYNFPLINFPFSFASDAIERSIVAHCIDSSETIMFYRFRLKRVIDAIWATSFGSLFYFNSPYLGGTIVLALVRRTRGGGRRADRMNREMPKWTSECSVQTWYDFCLHFNESAPFACWWSSCSFAARVICVAMCTATRVNWVSLLF